MLLLILLYKILHYFKLHITFQVLDAYFWRTKLLLNLVINPSRLSQIKEAADVEVIPTLAALDNPAFVHADFMLDKVLEQDLPLIVGQEAEIERLGQSLKEVYFPLKTSDTFVIEYLRSCTYPMTRQGINSLANSESPLKRTKCLLYKDFSPL